MSTRGCSMFLAGLLVLFSSFSSDVVAFNAWFEVDPADAKTSYEPGDVITINLIADSDVLGVSICAITSDNGGTAQENCSIGFPLPGGCLCETVNQGGILLRNCSGSTPFGGSPIPAGSALLNFEFYVPDLPESSIITIDDLIDMSANPPCVTSIMSSDYSFESDIDPVELHVTDAVGDIVTEVDWFGGESPPSEDWIILPSSPSSLDIISFSGPTDVFSNDCFGALFMGGFPALTINHENKTVQLWFEPPVPEMCLALWAPVCGLAGQFGPLADGNWHFFSNGSLLGGMLPFSIEFEVSDSLRLFSPNGGESLLAGSTHIMSWQDSRGGGSCSGAYVVKYSTDGGENWHWDDLSIVLGGCWFEWIVPSVVSDQVVVSVCDSADSEYCDSSDGPFSISSCGAELPGDFNGDCYVNGYDFAVLGLLWADGLAGITELTELAEGWLSCGDASDPVCLD